MFMNKRGFTLIELLIVVAIIAILAAIAVPNFLEAQTRAKVSRVKSDLRTVATAMEAYAVDFNALTRDNDSDMDREYSAPYYVKANGATQLTTPVSYLSGLLVDPFTPPGAKDITGGSADGYRIGSGTWSYPDENATPPDHQGANATFNNRGRQLAYVTLSPGPDKKREKIGYKCFPFKPDTVVNGEVGLYIDYDPTNGTVSAGDIYRFGGQFQSGNWDRNATNRGPAGPEQN
jgi:prepilin-type N-terminal cleavage/methylation domain-containing protein